LAVVLSGKIKKITTKLYGRSQQESSYRQIQSSNRNDRFNLSAKKLDNVGK